MRLSRTTCWIRTALAAVVLLLGVTAVAQGKQRLKLATLAPTGSSYHKSLLTMREAWRKASGGSVDLVIYADGKLGGETDSVGLMSVNSIQAAMLTAIGLAEIEPDVAGLQNIPMGFHDFDEVDYVGQKLQPMLEERLAKKGFVVLFWSDAGWVRFFSKKQITRPDDLKRLKLFTWAGDPAMLDIYRSTGFQPVPLETADILPSLQTGLIEAAPMPPVFALATQADTRAPFMLELNWAPLVGACIVRQETWDRIPAPQRAEMLKAAQQAGKEIKANSRLEAAEAAAAMQKRGLQITPVPPALEGEWRTAAEAAYPMIRGKIVPAEIFDEVQRLLKEYRARQPAK